MTVVNAILQPEHQPGHERTDLWYDVTDQTHTFMRIKACDSVHIVFSTEPGKSTNHQLECQPIATP